MHLADSGKWTSSFSKEWAKKIVKVPLEQQKTTHGQTGDRSGFFYLRDASKTHFEHHIICKSPYLCLQYNEMNIMHEAQQSTEQ